MVFMIVPMVQVRQVVMAVFNLVMLMMVNVAPILLRPGMQMIMMVPIMTVTMKVKQRIVPVGMGVLLPEENHQRNNHQHSCQELGVGESLT